MRTTPLPSLRLYSLDALRGVAALAVVVTHWPDFFFQGTTRIAMAYAQMPFHSVLAPFYEQGWRAVDFFFCLSGFIFQCLYSQRIADRSVRAGEFSLLRFSRLYPLHLATLLLAGGLQWHLLSAQGSYQVLPVNDALHFVQHLFFVSSWGWGHVSFNGPVWSVSVEVALYAIFFIACVAGWRRWWQLGLLAGCGFVLEFVNRFTAIGRGMVGFFLGALVSLAFLAMRERGARIPRWTLLLAAVVGWVVTVAGGPAALSHVISDAFPNVTVGGHRLAHFFTHFAFQLLPFQLLVIPWTILALAWFEEGRPGFGRRFAFLGDISYSSYMLHVPLQLVCATAFLHLGIDRMIATSPYFFLAFFAVLFALSLASYHGFERPAQRFLRERFLPRRSSPASRLVGAPQS